MTLGVGTSRPDVNCSICKVLALELQFLPIYYEASSTDSSSSGLVRTGGLAVLRLRMYGNVSKCGEKTSDESKRAGTKGCWL